MKESYKPLLTPWKIGKVEIKNRIVLTSMGGTDLFGWMEVNHFDKDGARFILEVAKNNAGRCTRTRRCTRIWPNGCRSSTSRARSCSSS